MLSRINRLLTRNTSKKRAQRQRSLLRSLEQLEHRQLLAGDIAFSTLAPAGPQQDGIYAIASDTNGNLLTASWKDWDGASAIASSLSKLDGSGTVIWEQDLGTTPQEITVDHQGRIYLLGPTTVAGLPVTSDAVSSDLSGSTDYYLAVLDSNAIAVDADPNTLTSSELLYATYFGGGADEPYTQAIGLATDSAGAFFIGGATNSIDLPTTTQPFVNQNPLGGTDGFVAKFSPTGDGGYSLSYSTYWGGTGNDNVTALALDSGGVLHIGGVTTSQDLPTTPDAFLASVSGSATEYAYLSRFETNGNLAYSTYIGRAFEQGIDLTVDSGGSSYIAGRTVDPAFPVTTGAFQETRAGTGTSWDAFISKFDQAGQLEYSSFYGGDGSEAYVRVEVENDQPILIGTTSSTDLPTQDAFQSQYGGAGTGFFGDGDSFVAQFAADGSSLIFASYLGGNSSDYAYQHTVNSDGNVYLAGTTYSTSGFPVTDSSTFQGATDGFLSRITLGNSGGNAPMLTVKDIVMKEGNAGTTNADFLFTLEEPLSETVTLSYATQAQTASAGSDFVSTSGVLEIPAGATIGTVSVRVLADIHIENDELFALLLSDPQGVQLSQTSPSATIQNDDPGALDSFDGVVPNGGVGDWTTPWSLTSNSAFTNQSSPNDGDRHAIIQRRGSLTRQVDTVGVAELNLSFTSKLRSFENSDRAYVQVSPDGSNWTTLKTFVNGEDDNTYRDYSFDIPFETDTLWIRFEGDMSSSRYDYWYIDTVRVTGTVASQPPVANDDSGSTAEDQAVTIDVLANDSDPDGDALSIISVTQPSSGAASIVGGQFQYTPNANFNGSDSFTYTVNDTAGNAAIATVNISVAPVNDAPISVDDSVTTAEDTPVTISVLDNDSDVDGDSLSVVLANDGTNGAVVVNADNTISYTPNAGFFGSDSFSYTITDGKGESAMAEVLVTVEEQNDPPVAIDDSATTSEDASLLISLLANDSDPDGDALNIQSVTQPSSGSATILGDQVRYTPVANFNGSDSFTYTIVDTAGNSSTATVDVTITPVNDVPVATGESYSLDQDTTLNVGIPGVLSNDTDIDGDALTAALANGPTSGSLTFNADGSFAYTPDTGFVGNDSFTYQAVDASGAVSESVVVNLQVNAVATGPKLSHGAISSVTGSWQTVSLSQNYDSAVIVATPRHNSSNSGPGVVRISNVTATSFDVRVDNVGSSAFSGGVHFIAMEEGVYDVPGEYKLEAVKVTPSTTSGKIGGWQISSQGYQQSYSNPVVVGQVMTTNDEDWSVFWSSSSSRTSPATSSALNVGKHVGEDSDTTRVSETLGYFVIEATSAGAIDGLTFSAGVGGDTIRGVDNGTCRYSNVTPGGAVTAVLSTAGMDGGDGGWAALMGNSPLSSAGGIDLAVDEDQKRDSERKHTTEQVAYFVIGGPAGEGEASSMAAPQITPHNPVDVNGDGLASPIDVLHVINRLNARSDSSSSLGEEGDLALDTSGDGQLSPLDALLVINHLNANSAEGETSPPISDNSAFDSYFGDLEDEDEDSALGLGWV